MSIIEMSHRTPDYERVHSEALDLTRRLFKAPPDWKALFLQGGATLQFAMVPMNLLRPGETAGYVVAGTWGKKAAADGAFYGDTYTAWSGADAGFVRAPAPDEIEVRPGTRFLHITSNETVSGLRIHRWPECDAPLVIDMSSDFLTRPIPWDRCDVVYGGAQKNLGPAGLTLVFVRSSVLEQSRPEVGAYLRYAVHAEEDSLYNTPPVFSIWMMGKVLRWVEHNGGLAAMEKAAATRASLIYEAIDGSDGYYTGPIEVESRSHMNVVFRLPTEDDEQNFVKAAAAQGLLHLKGHRSVGGIRASMYNALPIEGAQRLAEFMGDYR
jgi:phosphoserine aminotransferase